MEYYIEFKNVGRNQKSWTAKLPWDKAAILKEVRKNGGLLSREIECVNDDGEPDKKGIIIVGGWRQVGSYVAIGTHQN